MVTQTSEKLNRDSFCLLLAFLSGLGLVAAWWLPLEKPSAAFGRYNYWQFSVLVMLILAFAVSLVVTIVPPKWRRQLAFRVAAVFSSLFITLTVVEALCWLWPIGQPKHNPWYIDAKPNEDGLPFRRPAGIHWTGRMPGEMTYGLDTTAPRITFITDDRGFRNLETPQQAQLVFLGDSFTEGCGVDGSECFPSVVSKRLGQSVANLGRSAYSPAPELSVLNHYALPLRPATVIWQLCEGNDLEDSVTWHYWNLNGRPSYFEEGERNRITKADAWKQRSPTMKFYSAFRDWPWTAEFSQKSGRQVPICFSRPLQPAYHCPLHHPGWAVTKDALGNGQAILNQNDIRLLVILIPVKLRVFAPCVDFPPRIREHLLGKWDAPPDATWSNALTAFCHNRNIEFLDLTQPLQEATEDGILTFLQNDSHLSPDGHEIVAREIIQVLSSDR